MEETTTRHISAKAMTDPYLIAHKFEELKQRLLEKTYLRDDGCWYCEAGGTQSKYGTIWYEGTNLSNHVASWMVHKGPIPEGKWVCHTCDYKRCINPDHLFLGTAQDNINDCIAKGRRDSRIGERNPGALLNEDKVKEIKYFLEHSGMTQQKIADHFGVTQVTISQIKTGKRWAHV